MAGRQDPYRKKTSRGMTNIWSFVAFWAEPDQKIIISQNDVIPMLPFFRLIDDCHWMDATGEYDVCLSLNGFEMYFFNRLDFAAKFMYRQTNGYYHNSVSLE
jgi:hypothetical protein